MRGGIFMKTFEIDAKDIADQYGFTYDEINIKEIEKGNINNTFVIILKKGKRFGDNVNVL